MALEAQNNPFPSVLMVEAADETDPTPDALPAAGQQRLIVGPDHLLYLLDDAGVATAVGGAGGLSDPMTTRGDIIIRNASNVTARLGRGSASQVLTSDGTDVAWATPSGGTTGVGWIDSSTNPDKPPGSPNTEDDEFDAGSLDAKWTHSGSGGVAFADSKLVCTHAASATDEQFIQAYVPGASVAFTIAAKFSYTYFEDVDYVGLQILDASNAAISSCDIRRSGGTYIFNKDNPGGTVTTTLPIAPTDHFYMRISRDTSNVYTFQVSLDGVAWSTYGTGTGTSSTTVGKIGFRFGQTQTRSYKVGTVDWFRRT